MNLNKVILIGRISQEIVPQESRTGISYVRFNLAINRDIQNRNNEDVTDFIPLVAFDNTANFINRFFNRGDLVSVVGSLQSSQYTSKSGDNISSLSVLIDQIRSLEPRSVTQARAEKKNTISINTSSNPIVEEKPTFHEENSNNDALSNLDDDNPWELDF